MAQTLTTSLTKQLQRLVPADAIPPTLRKGPGNLYQVLSRTPSVEGRQIHQTRWTTKNIGDSYWRVTRATFKSNGTHGKAWGQLFWKGKLVTPGRDERIRGALKYKWNDGPSVASPPAAT
ncbi:hypothetical protein MKEN_00068600 [Mycena kentingensis (nom. inval.)]|nr:hypothetical protein MKEN_00068600 [Mycena kentingensis (nom. inval.)]